MMLLGQHLVREIKIVLIDEAAVETFSLLVEGTIAIIRQDPVLKGLFHSTIVFVIRLILNFNVLIVPWGGETGNRQGKLALMKRDYFTLSIRNQKYSRLHLEVL